MSAIVVVVAVFAAAVAVFQVAFVAAVFVFAVTFQLCFLFDGLLCHLPDCLLLFLLCNINNYDSKLHTSTGNANLIYSLLPTKQDTKQIHFLFHLLWEEQM